MVYVLLCIVFSLGQVLAACGYGRAAMGLLGLKVSREDTGAPPNGPPNGPPAPRRDDARRILFDVFALGLGLVCLSLLTALAALVMQLNRPVLAGIYLVGWGLLALPARMPRPFAGFFSRAAPRSNLKSFSFWLFVPPIAVLFLESLVPDYSGDAYLYHLSAPLFYVLEGGFVPQPYAFYYHYPLLMEMLYAPALAFGLAQAAILLNFWITMAAALALYGLGSRLHGRAAGRIAALLYLLAPSVLLWSPTAQPETGGTLLLILVVASLDLWRTERRAAHLALAGFLAGGLVGCKILYALFAIGIFVVLCLAAVRDGLARRLRTHRGLSVVENGDAATHSATETGKGAQWFTPAIFLVSAAAAYVPWLIKNALYTHNPFFPMLTDLFPTVDNLKAGARVFGAMHCLPRWQGAGAWLGSVAKGAYMLFGTLDAGFFAGMIAVPILCARAVLLRRNRFFWLLLLALFLVVCHYGGILQTRWFLPAYALFTLATAEVVCALMDYSFVHWPRGLRRAVIALVLLNLIGAWVGGYLFERLSGSDEAAVGIHRPWTGLTNRGRAEFLAGLPGVRQAWMVNRLLPVTARVLVMQPPPYPQVRWYRHRFVQNGQDWFGRLEVKGRTVDQIAEEFRSAGITYVVAPSAPATDLQRSFFKREADPLASAGGYSLYALKGKGEIEKGN